MWDHELEDDALEQACETIEAYEESMRTIWAELQARLGGKDAEKDYKAAVRLVKETVEAQGAAGKLDGTGRLRIGRYIIPTRDRAGGGFEVPTWEKRTRNGPIERA